MFSWRDVLVRLNFFKLCANKQTNKQTGIERPVLVYAISARTTYWVGNGLQTNLVVCIPKKCGLLKQI